VEDLDDNILDDDDSEEGVEAPAEDEEEDNEVEEGKTLLINWRIIRVELTTEKSHVFLSVSLFTFVLGSVNKMIE